MTSDQNVSPEAVHHNYIYAHMYMQNLFRTYCQFLKKSVSFGFSLFSLNQVSVITMMLRTNLCAKLNEVQISFHCFWLKILCVHQSVIRQDEADGQVTNQIPALPPRHYVFWPTVQWCPSSPDYVILNLARGCCEHQLLLSLDFTNSDKRTRSGENEKVELLLSLTLSWMILSFSALASGILGHTVNSVFHVFSNLHYSKMH